MSLGRSANLQTKGIFIFMAKDPSFLFYSSDFLIGTSLMSNEEVGQYIRILSWLHQHGPLEKSSLENLVGKISVKILSKLCENEEGLLTNKKLFEVIEKRKKFIKHQYENGKKGGRPKTQTITQIKPNYKPKEKPLENENENENINDNWLEIKKLFFNSYEFTEKICSDKNISSGILEIKMQEFISDLELKEDYKQLKELKSHFINWYNLKLKNGTHVNKQSRQAAAIANAIKVGKAEFAALRKEGY